MSFEQVGGHIWAFKLSYSIGKVMLTNLIWFAIGFTPMAFSYLPFLQTDVFLLLPS